MNELKYIPEDEFPLTERLDTIIPFEITKYVNGRIRCAVYPAAKGIFDSFAEKFAENPMSEQAISWLDAGLTEFASSYGYEKDDYYPPSVIMKYRLTDAVKVNQSVIQSTTVALGELRGERSILTLDLDEVKSEGRSAFCTLDNGVVVSAAAENPGFGDDFTEITVESAPDYRGRGFAASNTAALALYALKTGKYKEICYCCRESNIASRKTAQRCGFKLYARTYYFCAYHNI